MKSLARGYGRNPDHLLVMPGLFPILGGTEAEAHRRKRELDEQLDHAFLREELAHHLALDPDDLLLGEKLPFDKIGQAESRVPVASRWHRQEILSEARANDWTVRQTLVCNITGGHRLIAGTPEQVAGDILHWVDSRAADGFRRIRAKAHGLGHHGVRQRVRERGGPSRSARPGE